jgi:hypothetical protein
LNAPRLELEELEAAPDEQQEDEAIAQCQACGGDFLDLAINECPMSSVLTTRE